MSKILTGKVRLSYVSLFNLNDKGKYSVCLLIPKTDKQTVSDFKNAIEAMKTSPDAVTKWGGKWMPSFKSPLRDGDTDRDSDRNPEYKGHYFVNCGSGDGYKPGVVDRNNQPILDKSEVYSGCYGRATLQLVPFNVDGNKGISVRVGGVQKISDGDRIGGGPSTADFTVIEEDFLA